MQKFVMKAMEFSTEAKIKSYTTDTTVDELKKDNAKLIKTVDTAVQMLLVCEKTIEMLTIQLSMPKEVVKQMMDIIEKPFYKSEVE